MKNQVNKRHYNFLKYVTMDRFSSYYYQIKVIYEKYPNNILEVGVGNGITGDILKKDFEYKNIDIDEELNPDFIGDISNKTDITDNSFNIVCAFQVLEHLPFEKFEDCLQELKRISNKNIIISLPYSKIGFNFSIKLPLLPVMRINISIPQFYRNHKFNGQHYWEIGTKGYSYKSIKNILSKYFIIENDFIPFENTYHAFFILKKK